MSIDRIGRVQGTDLELFLKSFMQWTDGKYSVEILVQEDGTKFRVGDAGAWSRPWGEVVTRYSEGEVAPYLVTVRGEDKPIGTYNCVCEFAPTPSDFNGLCGICGGQYIQIPRVKG